MTDFQSVVKAWDEADPYRIHPTREHESEEAYWESGRVAALEMAQWIPEGGTVLDFGCGDGRLSIPLDKLGFRVIAVDSSPHMIERLNANGWTESDYVSDGTDLPDLINEKVDAVIARAVFIHHSHTDVIRMVKNLTKCLKPGGVLICDWPTGPHHERRDWIDVTTWVPEHRAAVAEAAGLELIKDGKPSVWRKQ